MSGHNHVIHGGPVVEGCTCEHCAMSDHTPPTDDELAELQARCDAATPGPWTPKRLLFDGVVIRREGCEVTTPEYDVCANIQNGAPIRKVEDAVFIAAARTDLPCVLKDNKRLKAQVERLQLTLKGAVQ